MPLLGTLLYNVVAAVAAWLLKYVTQKVAMTVAITTVVSALCALVYVAARAAITAAIGGAGSFHPMFGAGVAVVISPRTAALISSYVFVWSGLELFKWKMSIVLFWGRLI